MWLSSLPGKQCHECSDACKGFAVRDSYREELSLLGERPYEDKNTHVWTQRNLGSNPAAPTSQVCDMGGVIHLLIKYQFLFS